MMKSNKFNDSLGLRFFLLGCLIQISARSEAQANRDLPVTPSSIQEPTLVIHSAKKTLAYLRSELVKRKDAISLQVAQDPAYQNQPRTYRAIPLRALFETIEIPEGSSLEFQCTDGFSAPISALKVFNSSKDQATAYLAIEEKDQPWPALNPPNDLKSAGPFYLIWANPERSQITREEWPYQITRFEINPPLNALYPELAPEHGLKNEAELNRGFRSFLKNCFVCHTLNQQGTSKMGPDLNVPMNPTDYLTRATLKTLVRNPQDIHFWPLSKMKGFSQQELPDEELDEIITYLAWISKRKVKISP